VTIDVVSTLYCSLHAKTHNNLKQCKQIIKSVVEMFKENIEEILFYFVKLFKYI